MNLVFEVKLADKAKAVAVLEADPYANPGFSRNGYKVKDGVSVGQDKEKAFVFMRATSEFAAFAREKLKEVATEAKPEVAAAVSKAIEDEENSAEVGFGAIFG